MLRRHGGTKGRVLLASAIIWTLHLALVAPGAAVSGSDLSAGQTTSEAIASGIQADAVSRGALGAYWDVGQQELVLVAQASGPVIAASVFAGRGVPVRSKVATVSDADYQFAKDAVIRLVRDGTLKGESTEVSLNLRAGDIEVTSSAPQSTFDAALASLSGRWTYTLASGDIVRLSSRFNDGEPYWGGDEIKHYNGHGYDYCSSGFAVLKSGTPYMLTAGHCPFGTTNIVDGGGDVYGHVVYSVFAFNGMDASLIGGEQYGGYIWRGTDSTGAHYGNVILAGDPVSGYTDYCSSGYVSLEKCGLTATGTNILACDRDGWCSNQLVRLNGQPWSAGDSGGPIYAKSSGTNVFARATILFQYNGSAYGQMWSAFVSKWGVTICTISNC